jgi:signal transduction histidine kinase
MIKIVSLKNLFLLIIVVSTNIQLAFGGIDIDSLETALKNASSKEERMKINAELMTEYIHFNRKEEAAKTKRSIQKLLESNKDAAVQCYGLSGLLEFYIESSQMDSAQHVAKKLDKILGSDKVDFTFNSFKIVAHYYRIQNEFDLSKSTLAKGIEYFSTHGAEKNKYKLFGELALIHDIQGNIDSSLFYYDKQAKYFQDIEDLESLAAVFQNKGVAYYYQGNLEKAVKEFIAAKEVFEKLNDSITVFELNSNIGVMFNELSQFDKALVYFNAAQAFAEKYGDDRQKGRVYGFIGSFYETQDSVQKALTFHLKSLEYHQKIDSKRDIAINYHNIGTLYENSNDLNKALNYYTKAIELKKELGFNLSLAYSQRGLGSTFLKLGALDKAYELLTTAMEVFEDQNAEKDKKEVYALFADLYAKKGEFEKALDYHKKYVELKDKLESLDMKERINDLEVRYEVAKKDKELLELQQEKAEDELKIARAKIDQDRTNKILLVLIFISVLIIVGAVYYFRRNKRRAIEKKELAVNRAIFESEQKERIRIARDLHDSIGQKLAVTKMLLSSVESNENITKISSYIDETSNEVRNISHNLIPEILNLGLVKAIEDLKEKINSAGQIQLELKIDEKTTHWPTKKETEVSIYRIIQEIMGNIIKHSKTDKVLMEIKSVEAFVQIKIIDNGIGFNVDAMDESKGIGWKNIFARIKLINGDFKVQSEKNRGSQFFINIPTI